MQGIDFQTLLLETLDVHFNYGIIELDSVTLHGLASHLFFQTIEKASNLNVVTSYDVPGLKQLENCSSEKGINNVK